MIWISVHQTRYAFIQGISQWTRESIYSGRFLQGNDVTFETAIGFSQTGEKKYHLHSLFHDSIGCFPCPFNDERLSTVWNRMTDIVSFENGTLSILWLCKVDGDSIVDSISLLPRNVFSFGSSAVEQEFDAKWFRLALMPCRLCPESIRPSRFRL